MRTGKVRLSKCVDVFTLMIWYSSGKWLWEEGI